MIRIYHNVGQTIARLERFAKRLEALPSDSLAAEHWLARARQEAETVIRAIAGRQHQSIVPEFVRTITALFFGEPYHATLTVTMERVTEALINVADLSPEQQADIWSRRRQIIDRDAISEWVAQAKDKTAQDAGLSNDEITDRILAIFFGPPNAERENAAWSLLFGGSGGHRQHLLEHMAENRRGFFEQLIGTKEIDNWMAAVLNAWREMFLEEVPVVIQRNIQRAWAQTAK